MNIKEISKEIHATNVEKGFWEGGPAKRNIGEALMLVVSELGEAIDAHRAGRIVTHSRALGADSLNLEKASLVPVEYDPVQFVSTFEEHIKDSFEDELADTIIRLFDICEGFGIDIEWHIEQKLNYNKTRPYKHGKTY